MIAWFLLWNPVNIIDSEARWFLTLVGTLVVVAITSKILHWLHDRLHEKFARTGQYWKDATLCAILQPLLFYIWFLVIVRALDLISDRFLSESFSAQLFVGLRVMAVVVLGWFLVGFKCNITDRLLKMSHEGQVVMPPGKIHGISKLISACIGVLVGLLLMEVTGVNINTIIAFGGISGLAIAIASQEMISNFFGGLVVHINQPFNLGDFIQLPASSLEGHVEEIGWYMTTLRSLEKLPIYLPNSFFTKTSVVNLTRRTHRRIQETISVRQEDLKHVPAILLAIRTKLICLPGIDISQNVLVSIAAIGSYAIDLKIVALSTYIGESEFLRLRDEILMKAVRSIEGCGAQLAIPMEAFINVEPHSS
jgi:MscS family membrane protein